MFLQYNCQTDTEVVLFTTCENRSGFQFSVILLEKEAGVQTRFSIGDRTIDFSVLLRRATDHFCLFPMKNPCGFLRSMPLIKEHVLFLEQCTLRKTKE